MRAAFLLGIMHEVFLTKGSTRHLVLIFGDQLDADSAVFDSFDPKQDAVWMAEVKGEGTHVWSHKQRIAVFLAGMRHFRDELRGRGWIVHYTSLDDESAAETFSERLAEFLENHGVQKLLAVQPGEWRIKREMESFCSARQLTLEWLEDRHFLCSSDEFSAHVEGRKELRMEYFYREMRRKWRVLVDDQSGPTGGTWNFDKENRKAFGSRGPELAEPKRFVPDALTEEVLSCVERHFAGHPGDLHSFAWPVTREQALEALDDFVKRRLATFGEHQDAMWSGQPFLSHSLLSVALNLKLLSPLEAVRAAEEAWRAEVAPLPAVEGFIRQILGWREYVRGIYWHFMPEYLTRNSLEADERLPDFFWTGESPLTCLRETLAQTLKFGYAHHIQRLMVTGLYTLLLGVRPQAVHEWYLAIYVDAVEWVELPNTLGMSQYGDGGLMASKPYVATGKYIQRMSNYCATCPKNPALSVGPDACPFTTLYWDFLLKHEEKLRGNRRMSMQLNNLKRLSMDERHAIQEHAMKVRWNPAQVTDSTDPDRVE